MANVPSRHFTLGVLSTWSIYEGTTIDRYAQTLFQGMCAATRAHDCHLLLGCGISLPDSPRASRTAWSVPSPDADFIPIGPWNTDGMIIIPDDLSDVQAHYLQELMRSGFPIVSTTSEMHAPFVAIDNDSAIRQAMDHLLQHGHRQIAFIAGKLGRRGESAERLAVYHTSLHAAGLPVDPRLVAYGEHRRAGGRAAMEQILGSAVPFTAVLASNDLSALGAIEALEAAGRSIPHDVAVMGVDDILDTRSHLPPLSTVRHPTFAIGYQSVELLLDVLTGKTVDLTGRRLPGQLIIRQSCGCQFDGGQQRNNHLTSDLLTGQMNIARTMAEGILVEARHASLKEIEVWCEQLVEALWSDLCWDEPVAFSSAMQELAHWIDASDEDASAWQAAITVLREQCHLLPAAKPQLIDSLLDRARLALAQQAQRQTTHMLLRQVDMTNRLGLMTSQLLAAPNAAETAAILAQHLPWLNIDHVVVVTYSAGEQDPAGQGTVVLSVGLSAPDNGCQFPVRQFPPPALYPGDQMTQLAMLPLVVNGQATGFVAFSATNLEPCAAIAHSLAALLRTRELYLQALEGRRLAEEANRIQSLFLSTVSHELRTPLNLIVGLSEMVLREHNDPGALPQPVVQDLERIYSNAQHLGHLIGDVLDLASSEAGQLRLNLEPLDLAEVLGVVAITGAQLAEAKGLSWHTSLPVAGPRVWGDRTRLRQVVLNLISNAVKFTERGSVTLALSIADDVKVSISDTGPGVPWQNQQQIFDEFRSSDRTNQRGYGGLGLGLTICKHLVERHGGTIGVHSSGEEDSGATFFFTLPLDPECLVRPFQQPWELDSRPPGAKTILIVDDDPATAALNMRMIRQQLPACRVLQAGSGVEALTLMDHLRPNLVLLDLVMPELDGFGVLAAMRARAATLNVPVMVLTGRVITEDDLVRLNAGVATILNKGLFNSDEVLGHIEAALALRRKPGSPTQQVVRRAAAYIHAHSAEALMREQIATYVGMSADHLTASFRQELGVTPMAYSIRCRIDYARTLLEESMRSITEIALDVGFVDLASFSRAFHREVGITPHVYRRSKRR